MKTTISIALLLCVAACFCTTPILAQEIDRFVLNYESDVYQLGDAQQKTLDTHLGALANIPAAYIVKVQGHTDTDGSHYYNTLLSERRAKKVVDYLKAKGFNTKNMSMTGAAFDEPVATNDDDVGKSKNRRVEVTVELIDFSPAKALNIELEPEVFNVDGVEGAQFVTALGITIDIPHNAFEDKNGNPIQGDVQIEFQEYANPIDFLLADITMDYDVVDGVHGNQPGHFSSQGMFKISASQNGEELVLREEREIRVDMPIQGVPDVGWYQVDSATGKWNQLDAVTNNRGRALSGNSFNFQGLPNQQALRSFSLCPKNYELKVRSNYKKTIEYGKRASRTEISFSALLDQRETEVQLQTNNAYEFQRISKEYETALMRYKGYKRKYRVEKATDKGGNYVFDVYVSNNKQSGTEFQAFRYKYWEYEPTDSDVFLERLKKEYWDDIELLYDTDKKTYSMRFLQGYWDTIVNVKPFSAADDQTTAGFVKNWSRMYDEYKGRREDYRGPYERLKRRKDDALAAYMRFSGASDQLDTVTAFWIYSRQLMEDSTEVKMCMEEWLTMFENNKDAMRLRYDTLNNHPRVIAQTQTAERRARLAEAEMRARGVAMKILETKYSLTSLGMYNADQVKNLDQPILAKADYRTTKGDKFEPVFIYLIDDNINGLIEYNGFMGFSPYHFVFSSTSKNVLFAFDIEGNFYMCDDEQFKAAGGRPGDTVAHTFVMEKVTVKDKSELEGLLTTN